MVALELGAALSIPRSSNPIAHILVEGKCLHPFKMGTDGCEDEFVTTLH
jgi:hypothetical protein